MSIQIYKGLNVIHTEQWNKAAISKLLWAIAKKKNILWILWIHNQHIKGNNLKNMETPKQAIWLVRKIFEARKWINEVDDLDKFVVKGKYSFKLAYKYFLPQRPKAQWNTLALLKGSIPRQLILWIVIQNRLVTIDR